MEKNIKIMTMMLLIGLSISLYGKTAKAAGVSKDMVMLANDKARFVTGTLFTQEMSDYDKALVIHDWLCSNCRTSEKCAIYGQYVASDHSIVGPLVLGTACCEGYADTYKLFMDLAGIKNRRVN